MTSGGNINDQGVKVTFRPFREFARCIEAAPLGEGLIPNEIRARCAVPPTSASKTPAGRQATPSGRGRPSFTIHFPSPRLASDVCVSPTAVALPFGRGANFPVHSW